MNKIEQLIEKIIDDMGESPFAMTWETEARNIRKILKKHLQSLQDTTEEREEFDHLGCDHASGICFE